MLREGHWASPAPQSADPAGGSILHDPDQPGAGKSDHRHDPTRDHLGRSVFPDRRGGDHTGEPPHRTRLRRRRPAPLLSRRYIPAQHRQAGVGVVVMDRLIMTFVVGVLALGTSLPLQAHAFLDHASPAVGSLVPAAPPIVTLWFTQDLEPAFSDVTVTNEAGQRVDLGNAQIPQGSPAELRIALKPLAPGTYLVSWHVVSVDTHPTEGTFTFDIKM